MTYRSFRIKLYLITTLALLAITAPSAFAQGLNWDGQTGGLATPFAYASPSASNKLGRPQIAFHYLNGGDVVGNDFQYSLTFGFLKRFEAGYSRVQTAVGRDPNLAAVFDTGYNTFHGKVNFVSENAGKTKWVPAISAGFVAHTQVRRVGGVLSGKDTSNGDVYLVGTKVIPLKHLPILLNAGVKGTNASLLSLAGNSPDWEARGFGAIGFVLHGPAKSTVVVGSEVAQEPRYLKDLPGATLPTTLVYFARVSPSAEHPLNFDFGVVQAAGKVAPGIDVQARAHFAFAITYRL